jgi:hypothetical protein
MITELVPLTAFGNPRGTNAGAAVTAASQTAERIDPVAPKPLAEAETLSPEPTAGTVPAASTPVAETLAVAADINKTKTETNK